MSSYVSFNANPLHNRVGDCVIRAISKALNQDWHKTYTELSVEGYRLCDIMSSNAVWGAYLRHKGFERHIIPDTCPDCYTVEDFCKDHPQGTYILALSGHVIAVEDGKFYDSWYSGEETPIYYWQKKGEKL